MLKQRQILSSGRFEKPLELVNYIIANLDLLNETKDKLDDCLAPSEPAGRQIENLLL